MIYTHVMQKGVTNVRSPLDLLDELAEEHVQAALDASRRLTGTVVSVESFCFAGSTISVSGRQGCLVQPLQG